MSDTFAFSKLRSFFFPIHKTEFRKFFSMSLIIFSILFNYTLLRNMKDTLVVNSAGAGAITFLKLYCVTPSALLFVIMFIKLSNIFDREKLFYILISFFLVYFILFGFILYPNVESIHMSEETINSWYTKLPAFKGFIDIIAYWSYSIFYILAELWGSVGVQILFWQFANQVISSNQSKRFYALFIVLGNVGLIMCGVVVNYVNNVLPSILPANANVFRWSVTVQMTLVTIVAFIAMAAYKWLHIFVLPQDEIVEKNSPKGKKSKPGLGESFKMILRSKPLLLITALVVCYGISINLVEVQWKNQVKIFYKGNKAGFNNFMNTYASWTGFFGIIFGWFAASGLLRKLKWFSAAVITPGVITIGGIIFFVSTLSGNAIKTLALNPVAVATFMGAGILIASKVAKYSLFDTTKEMAYIPLSQDEKTKGKAAVEVVGGRFGKAGGALIQSILLMAMATKNVIEIAPVAFVVFIIICILWVYAVKYLSIRVQESQKNK